MNREFLQNIIDNFDLQRLKRFFSEKNSKFRPSEENFGFYNTDYFPDGMKLGELSLDDGTLLVCAFKATQELSERSGKKAQYELGKKILKGTQSDAGIFIYYNQAGSFRFSLIYANYLGKKRDWSAFRRFTYFVGNDLTNKTFKQRIFDGDFSSLEKIKDAFSVEKVTKEFYEDIANWYLWAVDHSTFPKDAEEEKDGRKIAVIRLITRMIFIWFMRERGLVPKGLFEYKSITTILKNLVAEDSTYYTAILQNLFFATLSTKKEDRDFRSDIRGYKGINPDQGNDSVFRYRKLFKDQEKLKKYFGEIPFLNGGLFECLDDRKNNYYVDGFTESKKDNQPTVPNFLFFSEEKKVDLNKAHGTKSKTYKVSGLLNILSSFNFTIDENSPDDSDIALDPELLGRVFENLLASFNPETSTTARKTTGSYYTPRDIVDYMVAESFKAYFKTHLLAISDLDKKIVQLFSIGSEENPFDKSESKKIVELIEGVRIVDPAVGSGAFPMGALNKLVFILGKVDPGNELWKQAQLSAADTIPDSYIKQDTKNRIVEFFKSKSADYWRKLYLIQKCIYGVDIQQIAVEIAKLRFFISLLVDEEIDKTKYNWGIEPLPNLDFKIMQGNSLISEFLEIDFDNGQEKQEAQAQSAFGFENEDDYLIKEFERKKIDYQNESDKDKKAILKNEVEDLMIKLFESKVNKQKASYFKDLEEIERKYSVLPNKQSREEIIAKEKQKLSQKTGFDLENIEKQLREFTSKKKIRPFFPWKLYFAEVFQGENPGFDIVIANPPYIGEKGHKELFREVKNGGSLEKFYQGKMDLFYFFFHLALNLGNNNSQVAFISTNYYPTALGARKLREDFRNRAIVKKLINFNELKIFKSATGQHNMVTILAKGQNNEAIAKTCIIKLIGDANTDIIQSIIDWKDSETEYFQVKQKDLYDGDEYYIRFAGIGNFENPLNIVFSKISNKSVPITDLYDVKVGLRTGIDTISKKHVKIDAKCKLRESVFVLNKNELNNFSTLEKDTIIKPLFKNSHIRKWYCSNQADSYVIYTSNNTKIDLFPNIKKHLLKYYDLITKIRGHNGEIWYSIVRPREERIFLGEKIVCPQRSSKNTFAYNISPFYASSDVYYIINKEHENRFNLKYVLALLNSKLYYLWLYHRGKRKGESLELYQKPLSEIPIKKISEPAQKPFIEIVDKILAITKSSDYLENPTKKEEVKEYEKQIDQMVYKLYDLTPEEIEIVENSGKK